MKKILFALALAVVATACHTPKGEVNTEVGKITIVAATRGTVTNSSEEGRLTLTNLPVAEELKVEIVGNNNTQTWNTLAEFNTAVAEGLLFASAPYLVTLSYGEKGAEGWSKPYFEGSASVDVPGYNLTASVNIEVALANSIITVATTEQFDGYFPQSSFEVKGFEWDATKEEYLYLNAGEATIICTAVRQSGATTTIEQKITLSPTTRHRVLFDLSTAGKSQVTISFDDEIVATEELEFELNDNA